MESFHDYMISQLRQYIVSELNRGSSWDEVEKALYNAGHNKNVIDEAFSEMKKENIGKKVDVPKKELSNDFVGDAKFAINNFFSKLKNNKEIDEIKEETEIESTDEIIDEAVEEVKYDEQTYVFEGYVFFLYLIILTFAILFTAGGTGDELILIVLGFSPTFLNAIVSFTLVKYAKYAPLYVMVPVFTSLGFYALARFGGIALFNDMDYESLSIVNAVIGMLFNVILINMAFMRPEHKKKEVRIQKPELKKVQTQKKTLEEKYEENMISVPQDTEINTDSIRRYEKHIENLKKEFNLAK